MPANRALVARRVLGHVAAVHDEVDPLPLEGAKRRPELGRDRFTHLKVHPQVPALEADMGIADEREAVEWIVGRPVLVSVQGRQSERPEPAPVAKVRAGNCEMVSAARQQPAIHRDRRGRHRPVHERRGIRDLLDAPRRRREHRRDDQRIVAQDRRPETGAQIVRRLQLQFAGQVQRLIRFHGERQEAVGAEAPRAGARRVDLETRQVGRVDSVAGGQGDGRASRDGSGAAVRRGPESLFQHGVGVECRRGLEPMRRARQRE